MMTIWKNNGERLIPSVLLEKGCWIEAVSPDDKEIEVLVQEYGIPSDLITDILDEDERPRVEIEGRFKCLITRIPIHDESREVSFFTLPLGIFITDSVIITLCARGSSVMDGIARKTKRIDLENAAQFLLDLMNDTVARYLRDLKMINRLTGQIEKDLQQAVKNTELIQLLRLEKSLLYFTTSLRENEMLLERFERLFPETLSEEQKDKLEDVRIEIRQAREMTEIYSNILGGMMDILASVISNNLNVVMKRLTQISLVLMIPTFIASLYGMNVAHLPFQDRNWAFPVILGVSGLLSLLGALFFTHQGKFSSPAP